MKSIGIRELRQGASEYIALVKAGETFRVTDRGRPVALLVPIPSGSDLVRLDAEGRLSRSEGDLLELGPPIPLAGAERAPSELLEEARTDER